MCKIQKNERNNVNLTLFIELVTTQSSHLMVTFDSSNNEMTTTIKDSKGNNITRKRVKEKKKITKQEKKHNKGN